MGSQQKGGSKIQAVNHMIFGIIWQNPGWTQVKKDKKDKKV